MPPNRFPPSAFSEAAAKAGIMPSRSGSASVAPAPRRIVLRDRRFFVMNILDSPYLEGHALDDPEDQSRPVVLRRLRIVDDLPHRRHVEHLDAATHPVGQTLRGEHRQKR